MKKRKNLTERRRKTQKSLGRDFPAIISFLCFRFRLLKIIINNKNKIIYIYTAVTHTKKKKTKLNGFIPAHSEVIQSTLIRLHYDLNLTI